MTDIFGIYEGVCGAAGIYFRSARGAGRTTNMIYALKEGDRVVFPNEQTAREAKRLCKERDVDIDCIIVPPKYPELAFQKGTSQGRTLFSHEWLEEYYTNALLKAGQGVRELQTRLSGYGEPHIKTKLKAQEIQKWRDVMPGITREDPHG